MPLKKQCASLELSKELKELGYPQESLFYWVTDEQDRFQKLSTKIVLNDKVNDYGSYWSKYSAPTTAELGEILPQTLKIKRIKYQLFCSVALDKQWFVIYVDENDYENNAPIPFMMCHNEADCRAKMLIYLLKNKLIELK